MSKVLKVQFFYKSAAGSEICTVKILNIGTCMSEQTV